MQDTHVQHTVDFIVTHLNAEFINEILTETNFTLPMNGKAVVSVVQTSIWLSTLSLNVTGQLDVPWHDCDPPSMYGTQVGVLKQTN